MADGVPKMMSSFPSHILFSSNMGRLHKDGGQDHPQKRHFDWSSLLEITPNDMCRLSRIFPNTVFYMFVVCTHI
jgi:hypothetical protein